MNAKHQGPLFRHDNATARPSRSAGGGALTTWFSPNMAQRHKPTNPPVPPDLQDAYRLMRLAQAGDLLSRVLPAQRGKDSIICGAIDIGRKNGQLLVMGAVSSPQAMPNYVPSNGGGSDDDGGARTVRARHPRHSSRSNVTVVRADAHRRRRPRRGFRQGGAERRPRDHPRQDRGDRSAVGRLLGDSWQPQPGVQGLVLERREPGDRRPATVRWPRPIWSNVLDVFEHYRFRAVQTDMESVGKSSFSGFLDTTDAWQDGYLTGSRAWRSLGISRVGTDEEARGRLRG